MIVSEQNWVRVCPFCNEVHYTRSPYLNVVCRCGGKFYAITGDWLDRKTGEKVKGLNNKCGCEKCEQHKTNKNETGFNCISFGFTRRILLNVLDCEESLTQEQKDAFATVINVIEKLDKEVQI